MNEEATTNNPPYAIEGIETGSYEMFVTARDAALYMWGRDFDEYRVYRFGARFDWSDGDLHAFERALEAIP